MKAVYLGPDDPLLDGDPEDFPHREEAMAEYRALWLQFLGGLSEEMLGRPGPTLAAQKRMDELQPLISHGPGKVWRAFRETLPGYVEWWGGAYDTVEALIRASRGPPPPEG